MITRHICPLCGWHNDTKMDYFSRTSFNEDMSVKSYVERVVRAQMQETEKALEEHFNTHTTVDYLRKLGSLQREVDRLKSSLNPNYEPGYAAKVKKYNGSDTKTVQGSREELK